MKFKTMHEMIRDLIRRCPILAINEKDIYEAYEIMRYSFVAGGKLLIAGNGGSASEANHIGGELMKGFRLSRKVDEEFAKRLIDADFEYGVELADKLQWALPAIALTNYTSLNTDVCQNCLTWLLLWMKRRHIRCRSCTFRFTTVCV